MSVLGMPYVAHYTKDPATHDLAALAELGIILWETFKMEDFSETSKVGFVAPELKFLDYTLTAKIKADMEGVGKSG